MDKDAAQPQPQPQPPSSQRPPLETEQTMPLRFVGSGSEYFRIWIVNLLLTLLTLGLYYPFAKVRRLRYFHAATEVGGHPLSFHADPWKMLRGYLLVLVMLASYTLAGRFSATAGAVAFVIVAALWPALWHSSMRFRLANTGWRGLRLRYTGRLAQAYRVMAVPAAALGVLIVLLWWLGPDTAQPPSPAQALVAVLPALVMAALLPLLLWLLKCLQHDHYALGEEQTRFSVPLRAFYFLALRTLGLGLVAVLMLAGLMAGVGFVVGLGASAPDILGEAAPAFTLLVLMGSYLLMLSLVGGYATARLQDLVWNGTRSAHIGFASRLSARALGGLWLKNLLLVALTLGLYYPFAKVAVARLRLQAVALQWRVDPDTLVAAATQAGESAAGDAAGDLFGFDVGL